VIDGGYLDVGINDTMKDLFVNLLGAFVFSIFSYLYTKYDKRKYRFVKKFILKREINMWKQEKASNHYQKYKM
jgi:hypothetical protein